MPQATHIQRGGGRNAAQQPRKLFSGSNTSIRLRTYWIVQEEEDLLQQFMGLVLQIETLIVEHWAARESPLNYIFEFPRRWLRRRCLRRCKIPICGKVLENTTNLVGFIGVIVTLQPGRKIDGGSGSASF